MFFLLHLLFSSHVLTKTILTFLLDNVLMILPISIFDPLFNVLYWGARLVFIIGITTFIRIYYFKRSFNQVGI